MKKQQLIKIIIIVLSAVALLYLLTLVLPLIYGLFTSTDDVSFDFSAETVSLQDYGYQSLDRSIYYTVYGDTEVIDSSNLQSFDAEAQLLYRYFTALMQGDADTYRACYSTRYKDGNELPLSFNTQKLYDISATLYSRTVDDNEQGSVYIVRFKIRQNDGSVFNVQSDITYTTCFRLIDGLIDDVLDYKVK